MLKQVRYAAVMLMASSAFADKPPPGGALQSIGAGERVHPLRAASITVVDGRIIMTSPWREIEPAQRTEPYIPVFDCYDAGANKEPYDTGPCASTHGDGPTYRYYFGPDYHNPVVSNDMTTIVPGRGLECDIVMHAWFWNPPAPEECYIAIFQFEEWAGCDGQPPDSGSGIIEGVLYYLGVRAASSAYLYFWVHIGQLTHRMPSDGVGGYLIIYARDYDPDTGEFTLATRCQPMLWGTGDAEQPPENRAGTQGRYQFDDDDPADGVFGVGECHVYEFDVCPDPLGAMILFATPEREHCSCEGDMDESHSVTIEDIAILLSQFGGPPQDFCTDIDGNGVVGVEDLALLLARFGVPCRRPRRRRPVSRRPGVRGRHSHRTLILGR